MAGIKNKEDWWKLLDASWEDFKTIFANVGAPTGYTENDHWWAEDARSESVRHDKPWMSMMEDLKKDRDHQTLHLWLERVWAAAPDERYIHTWKSWHDLCDLCSEYWVFDEGTVEEMSKVG